MLEAAHREQIFNLAIRLFTLNAVWGTGLFLFLLVLITGCGSNTLKLEGLVSDNFGNPVNGAVIKATMLRSTDGEAPLPPMTSTSQESGLYRIDNLQLGNYSIFVVHPDYESPEPRSELLTETQVLDFELHNRLSLQGTVLEADGQTPVDEAEIRITAGSGSELKYDKKTGTNGEFTVSNLKQNDKISIKVFKGSNLSAAEDITISE